VKRLDGGLHEIRVLDVSMIVETGFDILNNGSKYLVQLFNDEKCWISEAEALVICPLKLEAFK
jgi:hypothetical protein